LIFELGSPCVFPCFSTRSGRAISFWLRVLFTIRAQAEIVRAEILVNLFILLVSSDVRSAHQGNIFVVNSILMLQFARPTYQTGFHGELVHLALVLRAGFDCLL
jgi:hypothetical protein